MDDDFAGSNPYAAPGAKMETPADTSRRWELQLFLAWERLRILYNVILTLVSIAAILVVFPRVPDSIPAIEAGLLLVFLANVCFCVGPVLDGYARLMGVRHRALTLLIFGCGTGFAIFLALVAIHGMRSLGFGLN